MIYLDNAATTKVADEVLAEMLPYFTKEYGNPESVHHAAQKPVVAIKLAEKRIRDNLLHTQSGMVVFTSGGTEANNMAFNLVRSLKGFSAVTSLTEHKSVLGPAQQVDAVLLTPGYEGAIRCKTSMQRLVDMAFDGSRLFSFMHTNNETGLYNDVFSIGHWLDMVRRVDAKKQNFLHVDCVQGGGSFTVYADSLGADLLSFSAHKFHGPKGVGCLWISDRLLNFIENQKHNPLPMIIGGGQQDGYRAGTMNVPGIVGMGKAAEMLSVDDITAVNEASSAFAEKLIEFCDQRKIHVRFHFGVFSQNRASASYHDKKILSIAFPGADAETVVMIASRNGLCVSNGAACNSVSSEPSYVLLASGIDADTARSTVRVSFCRYNTPSECERAAEILADSVEEALSLTDLVQ